MAKGKVKGTMLVEFVKSIRANKTGAYHSLLNPEAQEVISQQILPTAWYPYEVYKNCFSAVVKVDGNNNLETVFLWGRAYGEKIVSQVYRNVLVQGDPMEGLKRYQIIFKLLFDFGVLEIQTVSETEALVSIKDFDPSFEPFYHMLRGWVERSLELCEAKDIKSDFVSRSWEGDPATVIRLSWT